MGEIVFDGIVTSGLGEGKFFMSLEHYKKEIKGRLGFDAYPGTLNIKVDKEQLALLKKTSTIKIPGFKKGNISFGGIGCYKAKIRDINGAVVIPEINRHEKCIVELIAPVNLKSGLKIKDGDKIKIELIG